MNIGDIFAVVSKMVMAGVASTKGNRGGGYEELLEA